MWQSRCENYFEMYSVEPEMWIKVATIHFTGPAARWLQSVERKLVQATWSDLCKMIKSRFGRDQHESLIRQLFHIKQTSTVAEYVESFSQLVDQLDAYQSVTDPLCYTMKFLDGLKDDVKNVVSIQRPSDLDAACALALLQEDVQASSHKREFRRHDTGYFSKSSSKGPLPLPPPPTPTAVNKPVYPVAAANKRGMDIAKGQSIEEHFASLRAYRCARGLCDKCGEKYFRGHKCSDSVQLHVVQELWDFLHIEQVVDDEKLECNSEHGTLHLSLAAATGVSSSKTMKFVGAIQGIQLLILVDSGSSHSFVSAAIASRLSGVSDLTK